MQWIVKLNLVVGGPLKTPLEDAVNLVTDRYSSLHVCCVKGIKADGGTKTQFEAHALKP